MIIPSKFIRMEYNPATDILHIEWPDIFDYSALELRFILGEVLNTIRSYDVKKILADSTKSVLMLASEEYEAIVEEFTKDLATTRLNKFARLTKGKGVREYAAEKAAEALDGILAVSSFYNKDEALAWLNA